jgi:hypothetical protein
MSDEPNQTQSTAPDGKKKSPALALVIGFLPSVLILSFLTLASSGYGNDMSTQISSSVFWLGFGISLICCLASSFTLFRRNTALAIFFGILFLLLNGAIAFFFGCAAVLNGMKF